MTGGAAHGTHRSAVFFPYTVNIAGLYLSDPEGKNVCFVKRLQLQVPIHNIDSDL